MKEKYDYIVIGAGIAGLSTAYYLGKDGYKVLVLEASDGKSSASYMSTAEMNHDPDARWDEIVEKFGIEGAKKIWKLCGDAIDTMSEFAHQKGEEHFRAERVPAYFYAYRDEDIQILRERYDFYKSIDAHVTLEEHPEEIHPSFRGILTTHGDGVTNNQMLLETLAHEVREEGGTILHNHKVVRLDGEQAITESGATFQAEHIIIATGDGGGLLPASLEIERKRTFVLSYENHELPEVFRTSVMWDTDKPYHYTRAFAGNRLWVGGEDVYDASYTPSPEEDEKKYALLDKYAREVLGTDDSYKRQAAWSGLFFPAKRGLPYIGEISGTAHIASVGFGGTGVITSFISGYLIAAWKRGEMLEYQELFALNWV